MNEQPVNQPTEQEEYGMSVEQAQRLIAEGEKVQRLMSNPDFTDVIMNGFIRQSALNKVSLLAMPEMKDQKENIMLELEAISILDSFLRNIQQTANAMKQELAEYQESILVDEDAPEGVE